MNTKELIIFLVFLLIIMLTAFAGIIYDNQLKHECRMEAIKALTDISRINEICK